MLYALQRSLDWEKVAIGLIWLFHLSAIIGISLGFSSWFMPKTPLNLCLAFFLLIYVFPINNQVKVLLSFLFFSLGMLAEWLGVHYGLLFGSYVYGSNLGPKLDGVPLLIGINWTLLVFISGAIANRLSHSLPFRIILGAGLMVFLDIFMEHSAPIFDFWTFSGGTAPLQNYMGWFVVAVILHLLFQIAKIEGRFPYSLHLYSAQLLFFGYFYFI